MPGNRSLDPGVSWSNLINQPSSQDSSIYRVVPGRPDLSPLFHKLNCTVPGVGARRPYLLVDDQALIYDWISAGAPPTTTDVIFL